MHTVRWSIGLRRDTDIPGGGIWDSSSLIWKNETGETVSWSDGNAASFPQGGAVTLAADVVVTTLTVGGSDFTLSGSGVLEVKSLVADALRTEISCPIYTPDDFEIRSGLAQIKGLAGVYLSTNEWRKIGEDLPLASLGGFAMSDHSAGWNAEGGWKNVYGCWKDRPEGGVQTVDTLSSTLSYRQVRFVSQSDEQAIVEYRRLFEDYGVYWLAALQVSLKTEGTDLLAKVIRSQTLRVKGLGGIEVQTLRVKGLSGIAAFDAYSYSYEELASGAVDSEKGGSVWPFLIYDDEPWADGTRPAWKGVDSVGGDWQLSDLVGAIGDFSDFTFRLAPQVTISGRLLAGGKVSVGENLRATFAGPLADCGSAAVSERAAALNGLKSASFDAVFTNTFTSSAVKTVFAMPETQVFGGVIRTEGGDGLFVPAGMAITLSSANYDKKLDGHSAAWHISGTVRAEQRYAFSLDRKTGSTLSEILDGGRLVFAFENSVGGAQPLLVQSGGRLVLSGRECLGGEKPITVLPGGVVENAWLSSDSDGTRDADRLTSRGTLTLSGGSFVGIALWFGGESWGWYGSDLTIAGDSPSVLAVNRVVIDFPGGILKGACTANFIVPDVTGDEASDLIVESPVARRSDGSTPTDYTRWAYGIRKKGAGTLELRGVSTFGEIDGQAAGQTFLEGGTLRLAASATGSRLGRLQLAGSASLQLDEGASVEFADSREIAGTNPNDSDAAYSWAWASDATLTLKSRIDRNTIRFGTDANGLTAAQLAAIRYDESVTTKPAVFTLTTNGYLSDGLGNGLLIRLR